MKDKLTLSIEEDIIEFAHRLSEETNQSISSIVEKHLVELKEIKENQIIDRLNNIYNFLISLIYCL